MPVAVIIRLIPDELFGRLIPSLPRRKKSGPSLFLEDDEDRIQQWNPAIDEIREELTFLKKIRGGRMAELAYKLQHPRDTFIPRSRSPSRSRSDTQLPQTPKVIRRCRIYLRHPHLAQKRRREEIDRARLQCLDQQLRWQASWQAVLVEDGHQWNDALKSRKPSGLHGLVHTLEWMAQQGWKYIHRPLPPIRCLRKTCPKQECPQPRSSVGSAL